jgi:pilus assembly protein CpaD
MIKSKFLIAVSFSTVLAGCGSIGANTSVYSTNQPVVERSNFAIDVNSDSTYGIAGAEKVRLAEWLDAMKLGYGDRIAIDYGDSYPSAAANQAIAEMAAEYGVLMSDSAPLTAGRVTAGTYRIVVTRSSASVPNCPNWSKTTEANYNSSTHPNYGCAINSNIAAMIADPEDLIRGRSDEKIDRNSGTRAVETHRAKTNGGK